MSTMELLTIASPVIPLLLLGVTVNGRWPAQLFGPPQFAAMAAETMLAAMNNRGLPQACASCGLVLAAIGLLAIACPRSWVKYRSRRLMRWEEFERKFHSYAEETSGKPMDGPSSTR